MYFFTDRLQRRRGVVLVLTLGFILMMTWLSLAILDQVRRELALKSSPANERMLRNTAYQLLEVSMGVLAEIQRFEGGLYSPSQGWGVPLAYAGMQDSDKLDTALRERPVEEPEPRADDEELLLADADEIPAEGSEPTAADASAEDLLGSLLEDLEEEENKSAYFDRAITRVEPKADSAQSLSAETLPLALPPGVQARVRLYDESGKLSLTATTPERWKLFFEAMEFDESEALMLTDSLLDWMDPDNEVRESGAESNTYGQEDPPYKAANRSLRNFRELRFVEGFKKLFFDDNGLPNEHLEVFRQNVSLYHQDEVNLNTASDLVLETLAEEREFDTDNVLEYLAGVDMIFGTEDDRILRPGLDEETLPRDDEGNTIPIDRPVHFIRVEIAVSSGQAIYTLNAVLDVSQQHPGGAYPFKIVEILENQPITG